MGTLRWLFACCIMCAVPLCAETPPGSTRSLHDIRLDLFGPHAWPPQDTTVTGTAQSTTTGGKKSVGLAAVYSFLLPGMGELYAGNFSSGTYFLIAEGVLWLTYAAFEIFGNELRDDARVYAAAHAGVAVAGKDDQFFIDVGNFTTVADYNDKKLRDREPAKLYDPALGYAWQWESDADRLIYRDQRVWSETMYNNRKFVAAAVLINHLASAINAARAAIAHNSALDKALGDLQFSAGVMGPPGAPQGVLVTLTRTF